MYPWNVDWTAEAKRQLATAWLNAADRGLVTVAADHIDHALAGDPRLAGQFLSEGLWKIVMPPLVVYYEFNSANRTVKVTGVATIA